MKTKNLFVLIIILIPIVVYAQDCEKLAQENKELKTKLAGLIDTTQNIRSKSFDPSFKVEIGSVIGYKEQQAVEIVFIISHDKVHQQICMNFGSKDLQAYDEQGNVYDASHGAVGLQQNTNNGYNSYVCDKIPTSIPVKSAIRLRKVLPSVDTIKKLILKVGYRDSDGNQPYNYGMIEFDNLKIIWK